MIGVLALVLAIAGAVTQKRIWNPVTGEPIRTLQGHQGVVLSVCPVMVAGRELLASGGEDRTVRIWDPATGVSMITIPVHHEVLAVHEVATLLAVGFDTGMVMIKLDLGA